MKFLRSVSLKSWILACACLVIFLLSYFRIFQSYELISYDLRFKLRPPLAVSPDIIVIEISDDSLKNLGQWPLPRDFHASLISVLKQYGAKAIVFDILFSEPTLYDEIFSQAIKDAGNVYLPLAFYIKEQPANKNLPPTSKAILCNICSSLKEYSAGQGHINVFIDPDGKVRRIPLFVKYQNRFFPHLSLKVASDSLGLDLKNLEFKQKHAIIDKKLSIPLSANASLMVNYPDKWVESFRHLSYFDILKTYSDINKGTKPRLDLAIIKDKVCFVGLTATGTADLSPTPLENIYPMLGLQASVFNSLLKQRFITDAGPFLNTFINIVIFFLSFIVCARLLPLKALLGNVVLAVSYFFISVAVLIFYSLWIDSFLPLFIIGFTYVGSTLYRFLDEARKRQLLEKELDIARRIQRSFLPQDIEEFSGLKISSFMQPAKFVGGDFYDVIVLDDKRLGVFIGDVSGKGVPAALIMAQAISFLRIFVRSLDNPAAVLNQLNRELFRILKGRFITGLYLIIDTQNRLMRASCAGHFPIIFYNSGDAAVSEILPVSGPPLGILDTLEYENFEETINKGDRVLLYTDGVLEARNKKGEEFGALRLKDSLFRNQTLHPQLIFGNLKKEIFGFYKGMPQHDDITLILLDILAKKE